MFRNLIWLSTSTRNSIRGTLNKNQNKTFQNYSQKNERNGNGNQQILEKLNSSSEYKFNFAWKSGLVLAASAVYLQSDQDTKQKLLPSESDGSANFAIIDRARELIRSDHPIAFETEFAVFQPMIITWQEVIMRWGISIFTAGIGFLALYPLWEWEYYSRVVRQLKWHNGKRLILDGDVMEFYRLNFQILVYNIVTLGFYSILGYSKAAVAKHIDRHIREI